MVKLVVIIFKIIDRIEGLPYEIEYAWFCIKYPIVYVTTKTRMTVVHVARDIRLKQQSKKNGW